MVLKHLNEMYREGVLTEEEVVFVLKNQTPISIHTPSEITSLFVEERSLERGLSSLYPTDRKFIAIVVSAYLPHDEVRQTELTNRIDTYLKEVLPSFERPQRLINALVNNPLTRMVIGVINVASGYYHSRPELVASGLEDIITAWKDMIHGNFFGEDEYRWRHGYSVP